MKYLGFLSVVLIISLRSAYGQEDRNVSQRKSKIVPLNIQNTKNIREPSHKTTTPENTQRMNKTESTRQGKNAPYTWETGSTWFGKVIEEKSHLKPSGSQLYGKTKPKPSPKAKPSKQQFYSRIASQKTRANGLLRRGKTLPFTNKPSKEDGLPPYSKNLPYNSKNFKPSGSPWFGKIIPYTARKNKSKSPKGKIPSYTSRKNKPKKSLWVKIIPYNSQNTMSKGSPWIGKIIPYPSRKNKPKKYQRVEIKPDFYTV